MSIGRPNIPRIVDQDTYAQNQEFIKQAEERLRVFKEMNEQGRVEYERMLELKRKVKEGEEARQLLESLAVSRPQITAPPVASPVVEPTSNTTRIEELGAHQPLAHSASYAQAPDPPYNGNAYPSSTSQSASGSGPSNPQRMYSAAGPPYAPMINSTHPGYTYPSSTMSTTSYGPAFQQHAGNQSTSYQGVASMQNQPRAWHTSQKQQQVANMSVDPNQVQTNTQNTPVQVYTPVTQPNPPPLATTIVKPTDIVSLISIPEVENIYKRTLSWIQDVPAGSYCELPNSQCSVHKNEDGRIYIAIPPINGLPQSLPVSEFFEKWKLLVATATRHMKNNPSQPGSSRPTQPPPQSNAAIVIPHLPPTNLPQVSIPVESSPRVAGSSSQSQPQLPPVLNPPQQPQQPRSSQFHPQKLPQPHPPQLPQSQLPQHYKAQPPGPQPRPQAQHPQVQPPNLQQPVSGTQTQLLRNALLQAQSQINSRPQNYAAQPEPQPSTSAQEPNATTLEGSRNSPDIVQITLPKRRAPGDADKKRLAKDLLFALGKRVRPDTPADGLSEGSSKKHVSEQMVQSSSSSLAPALDYNVAYKAAAQVSNPPAVSSRPNIAPVPDSSYHTFSIAGPVSGWVSYAQASAASSAVPISTKAPQYLYPIVNTVTTAPPAPPVTRATTSELVETPNPKPSTPSTAPVNTGASSGAVAASSIEIASVPPPPSTDSGGNPYRVLLTTTTNTIPRASVPIVPQRSSHESSTPVAQPTTAPLTASKDKAIASGPSVTSTATQPIASSSASTSQVSGEQQEEPLFLPGTPEEGDSEIEIIEQPVKPVKKPAGRKVANRAYVLIPKPSAKIRRFMQRKSAPSDVRSSHRNSMVVSETESEEDFSVPLENINVIDKAAQEAIRLSASRIEVLPCKWDGCDVVTNCPQTLINHLEKAHKSHRTHFTCLWTQCGRRCHQNENHLEKHASIPYRCAYKGCAETFRSGSTLLKHFRRYHKGGELKPSARPVAMGLKPIPKTPTEPLPAYLCLSRVAQPTPLTSKQHASLGPWVLRNINESDTSQTWQKKKTSRYNESTPGGNPGADYEYLITRTLRPSSYLSTPAHVELADIGMNSEFYEGQRYDESLIIFNRRQAGEEEVEELNSPNSPLFELNRKAKEVVGIEQDHDEGDG